MQQSLPKIATKHSIKIQVEKDKTYYWCSCGLSANQPFCDGSHSGTGFAPIAYTATEDRIVGFCGCKHSEKGPICDGTHKKLDDAQ
jgi:CDGSH-type Zn-finger protein